MSETRRIAAVGVAVLAGLLATAPARANEFTINACQADRAEFSTRAFEEFANRGMMWRRACNPIGPGLRGLITSNVIRAGRVQRGSRAYFVLNAPAGTHFTQLSWSGDARRDDCRYALQLWATRPNGSSVAIKNVKANRGCPMRGAGQTAGWPTARLYDIDGATRITQRVLCVGSSDKPYCSAHSINYIRTFKARATVVDTSPPGVTITQDNPFTRGAWVHGTQQVDYSALDNVGVRLARAVVAGQQRELHRRACNFAFRIPCPNGAGRIAVETSQLPDGTQGLVVRGEDAAGNAGNSGPVTVRIDNTAPGAVAVAVQGGETWRNQNDFSLTWMNPPEPDRAPISAAHFRLCPTTGTGCVSDERRAGAIDRLDGLVLPGPGEWQFRLWREDAATNQQPANVSVPVTLRYDPSPPALGFEDQAASDPTRVSVLVDDKLSGLGSGQIEISARGSGVWAALPTSQQGQRLVARVDDARLPAGEYELRATARDRAANENSSNRRLDGTPMVVTLPLRTPTRVRAGVVKRVKIGRRHNHGHRRSRTILAGEATVRLGHQVKVAGQLKARGGRPIAGAEVQILERSAVAAEHLVATVRTDQHGRWAYLSRASSTSVFRAYHSGTATTLPSQREVKVLVPAASTIRATPHRLLNGQAVTFHGRLRSRPLPIAGKLVELQVVLSGRWQTFQTSRSNASGGWRVRYRFRRSCGTTRYRFRAQLPAESGYPFEAGRTRSVVVVVRGRPCV